MNEAILCCKCGQTPKYSEESYHLIHKDADTTPPIYAGSSKILDFWQKLPKNSNIGKYVRAISRVKTKFSYYVRWDDNGDVIEHWDLLKGRRLQ